MSPANQQPALLVETHRNHYLFSDYYLDNRVQQRSEWQNAPSQAMFQRLHELWRDFTPNGNEAQTENDWIRPVLQALGHTFNVQVAIATPLGNRIPDYVFYPDDGARQLHIAATPLGEQELKSALAVGDAKAWERPLDQPIRAARTTTIKTSENPSFQIDFYIRHTGLPWGILTNGRQWRLYHRDTSKKLDVFYEVDLPALLEQADEDNFKYFYLFFRREAFSGSPSWLELILAESQSYEQGISDTLKDQVYEALRELAQGCLDFPANRLQPTPDTLKRIYDNSLIVLYRLLFILYAESRGLLPVDENPAYTQSYSLHSLKKRIVDDLRFGTPAVPSMSSLWDQLHQLWQVLSSGNNDLDVPAYNGGLFSPALHPFLEEHKVGDRHLRLAIDLLARAVDPASGQREFVDYRDLEIRHLGSIYEGLLEYQLRFAEVPLIVVRAKNREVYQPLAADDPTPTIRAGQVYLVTDKGERKATGSYYTPDYIVQYIVEQTVGPVMDRVRDRYVDAAGGYRDEAGLVRAMLALNVLDPAMGSGHFLVGATDFMARYLVELGLTLAESQAQGSELSYWRRRVVQACIYGVDLNPLAVELAKLSLWLNTVARDKPLSFLDHHLRCGNSLIGARVADLQLGSEPQGKSRRRKKKTRAVKQEAAGQLALLNDSAFVGGLRTATRFMSDIESLQSETLADVKEAERIYQRTQEEVTRGLRAIANVWTARHFGLDVDDDTLRGLTNHILHHSGFMLPQYDEIIAAARQIAHERRFFHWELAFPEVFFDREGQVQEETAGFDAVIGNPPYISTADISHSIRSYFRLFSEVSGKELNTFGIFTECAIDLTTQEGSISYIVPDSFLNVLSYIQLRELILERCRIRRILEIPGGAFKDAIVGSSIVFVISLEKQTESRDINTILLEEITDGKIIKQKGELQQSEYYLNEDIVFYTDVDTLNFVEKLRHVSVRLGDITTLKDGIKTGNNSRFVTRDCPSDQHKPILTNSDISRYGLSFSGLWVLYDRRELARPREESIFLATEKIVTRQTGDQIIASVDHAQYYSLDNTHIILWPAEHYSLSYVLSVINSLLLNFVYQFISGEEDRVYAQVRIANLEKLPIRRINFTTPPDERARLTEKGQRLYAQFCTKWDYACVLGFVDHQLDQEPEQADVVHDLLAFLAEQMIELNQRRQLLEDALDPFKYLDQGAPFQKLSDVFSDAIKYGKRLETGLNGDAGGDLGNVHHDIDGLRLVRPATVSSSTGAEKQWELHALLKLRDPQSDWQAWSYEADGRTILRRWTPLYRFNLDPVMARYYSHALPVLRDFANAKSFPGGRTRSTAQKLQGVRIPVFSPSVNLEPLDELTAEVATVRTQIERTDTLIDPIVYRLYGLSEAEIAIVEGAHAGDQTGDDSPPPN